MRLRNKRSVITEKFPKPSETLRMEDKVIYVYRDKMGRKHRNGSEPAEIHSDGKCYHFKFGENIGSENRKDVNEQIEEIINNFDFEHVSTVMGLIGWEWRGEGVPNAQKIQEEAKRLLVSSYEDCVENDSEDWFVSSGGLRAVYYMNSGFTLEFIIEEWNTLP
jgi:hypothetical protein